MMRDLQASLIPGQANLLHAVTVNEFKIRTSAFSTRGTVYPSVTFIGPMCS
jgi:hypothetical protein